MGARPSTHLGPASLIVSPQSAPRPPPPPLEPKPPLAFLDMYDHLMREIEAAPGSAEEPQDLSLHQLSQGMSNFAPNNFCLNEKLFIPKRTVILSQKLPQIVALLLVTVLKFGTLHINMVNLFYFVIDNAKMDVDFSDDYSDSEYEASRGPSKSKDGKRTASALGNVL